MLMCCICKLGPSTATSRALEGQQHPQLEPCSAWGQELPLEGRDPRPMGLIPCREGERDVSSCGSRMPGAPVPPSQSILQPWGAAQ